MSDNNMYARVSNAYNLTIDFFMLDRLRNENTVKKDFLKLYQDLKKLFILY